MCNKSRDDNTLKHDFMLTIRLSLSMIILLKFYTWIRNKYLGNTAGTMNLSLILTMRGY